LEHLIRANYLIFSNMREQLISRTLRKFLNIIMTMGLFIRLKKWLVVFKKVNWKVKSYP